MQLRVSRLFLVIMTDCDCRFRTAVDYNIFAIHCYDCPRFSVTLLRFKKIIQIRRYTVLDLSINSAKSELAQQASS